MKKGVKGILDQRVYRSMKYLMLLSHTAFGIVGLK